MKPKLIEDLGMFPIGKQGQRKRFGVYECPDCHKHWQACTYDINSGNTEACADCGHIKTGNASTTHGMSNSRLYKCWCDMHARCYDKKNKRYPRYGSRGITVCKQWGTFVPFSKWAISQGYSEKLTIERINNESSYKPSNCKWILMSEQSFNKSIGKNNTSGYVGIIKTNSGYIAQIGYKSKSKHIGSYRTIVDAVNGRNGYIREHNLPHKLGQLPA